MPNRDITFLSPRVSQVCGISFKRKHKSAGATIEIVDVKKANPQGGNVWRANLSAPSGGDRAMIRWVAFDELGNVLAVATRLF